MRTQVAIVGAGPAGLLLSHLLDRSGIESVIVETRERDYVEARIRAGILEQSTTDLLREAGLGDRMGREGEEHRGIYLQLPHERHHVDFVDLVGRRVTVYGQTELTKDLGRARAAAGQEIRYGVSGTAAHDPLVLTRGCLASARRSAAGRPRGSAEPGFARLLRDSRCLHIAARTRASPGGPLWSREYRGEPAGALSSRSSAVRTSPPWRTHGTVHCGTIRAVSRGRRQKIRARPSRQGKITLSKQGDDR